MKAQRRSSPWSRTPESDCCPESGEYIWYQPWYLDEFGETHYGAIYPSIAQAFAEGRRGGSRVPFDQVDEHGINNEAGCWRFYSTRKSPHLWSAERDRVLCEVGQWPRNSDGLLRAAGWLDRNEHKLTRPARSFFDVMLSFGMKVSRSTRELREEAEWLARFTSAPATPPGDDEEDPFCEGVVDRLMLFALQFQRGMIRDTHRHPLE